MIRSLVAASLLFAVAASADAPAQNYTVTVDAPAAKVGAAGEARVKVTPAAGFHVNKDYPTSLKVVAPAGVEVAKAMLGKADGKVEEAQAVFAVGYTAKEAGKKTFTGTLKFAVCTASTCDPRTVPVQFTVDVSK